MNRQHDVAPSVAAGIGTRQSGSAVLSVLAAAGIFAPIVFTVGFVAQGFLRTDLRAGYNPIAQQISDLTAGPYGWVQQVNFVVFGLLMIAFAVGLHRGVRKAWPWMVGPALVAWNGVELMIAGFFPLRENAAGLIYDPIGVHMVNGTIFFLSIGVVLVVMARRLAHDERWRGLATYTLVTAIALLVMVLLNGFLAEMAQAPLHPWLGLIQRAILAVWFPCLVILALRLRRVARAGVLRGATEEGTHMTTPSSNIGTRVRQAHSSPPSTPRWVKVSVIIFIVLVLLVLMIELTGHGFGGPMMRMSTPMHMATIEQGGHQL